jgi:hypothetical protein
MPIPSSLTDNYDALLSLTMRNYKKQLEDDITTANKVFYMLKQSGNFVSVASPGERAKIQLRYANGKADTYDGYDILDTTPMDGITSSFYQWRQMSVPVTISGREEILNQGENQIMDLLEAKIEQAKDGIIEFFNKSLLQGQAYNDTTSITSDYTSSSNASVGINPISAAIHYLPSSSFVIGNINQSTNTWWRNQKKQSAATTYAGWLKELRNLNNNCSKGSVGGPPDMHICEQQTYELYEAALAAAHRNPSYQKADLPFDAIGFKGKPVVWDEFIVDVHNSSTTISKGSWYMVNSKYMQIQYAKNRNFDSSPFQRPTNQDAKTSQIMWLGALLTSNRRKHGVMGNIDLTIAA